MEKSVEIKRERAERRDNVRVFLAACAGYVSVIAFSAVLKADRERRYPDPEAQVRDTEAQFAAAQAAQQEANEAVKEAREACDAAKTAFEGQTGNGVSPVRPVPSA